MLSSMKYIGAAITGVSAIAFVSLLMLSVQLAAAGHATCPGLETGCTLLGHFPFESFAGLGALAGLMLSGVWISLKTRKELNAVVKISSAISTAAAQLKGDEKKLYDFVLQNEGTAFQSDVVNSLGYPKVKVSRILDRLEVKGLLERRRRGMANLIVLKKL